jgi:hypothetical protein
MSSPLRKSVFMFFVAVVLSFSLVIVASPSVAHARPSLVNGGAVLQINGCSQNVLAAHVSGINQDGHQAEWDSHWAQEWNNRTDRESFETWNWYWSSGSPITVTMELAYSSYPPMVVSIPLDNTQDPYPTNCYYSISGGS